MENSLLLQIILPGTPGLAPGERALVSLFASVHGCMPGEVTAGRKNIVARAADELLFGQWVLDHWHDLLGLLAMGHVAGWKLVVTRKRVCRLICCVGVLFC